jgi:hypothetical protein
MEGTRTLMILLRDWKIQLLQIMHHVEMLDVGMKDLRQKILYALSEIGVLVKTSELQGGQLFDNDKIINSIKKYSLWERGVYDALEEVETAWPFISANIQLLKEFTESAKKECDNAEKLSLDLIPTVENPAIENDDFLNKSSLSAFNKQMAIVYSKIGVLGDVTKDIIGDMTNAIKLFENVRSLNENKQIRSNIKETISKNIDAFLISSVNFTQLFMNILDVVKDMKRPSLLSDKILRKNAI